MKYADSPWKYRCETTPTEMPSNLFFAENRIDYDTNLGGGKFTAIQAGKYKNFDKSVLAVIKRIRPIENRFRGENVDMSSVRFSFHQSWTLLHKASHPHIGKVLTIKFCGSFFLLIRQYLVILIKSD